MAIIDVKVKPNSRHSSFEQQEDGSWLAHVKATPVDGKANAELIGLVAKHFGVSKSSVSIRTGASGRLKRIIIEE